MLSACSTPISPYAQIDEDGDGDEQPSDWPDASISLDSGSRPRRDAGAARDSGTARDSGPSGECSIPSNANYASLFDDGCESRPVLSCSVGNQTSQRGANQRVSAIAQACGSPANATIGVIFRPVGCPTHIYYTDPRVVGNVSVCIQTALENVRFGCDLRCASSGPAAR
jgi:hypothetical protein